MVGSPGVGGDDQGVNIIGGGLVGGGESPGQVLDARERGPEVIKALEHGLLVAGGVQEWMLGHNGAELCRDGHAPARRRAPAQVLAHDHGVWEVPLVSPTFPY